MNQPKDFTVTVELQATEINLILAALQELPAKICNPLSQKIIEQAGPQTPTPEETTDSASNDDINDDPVDPVPPTRPAPKIIKPRAVK